MCVTYCHRRNLLYWDHEDCHPALCSLVSGPHGPCESCRYRDKNICLLTNSPLPKDGGCCHHNVELVQGEQIVTQEMLELLELDPGEMIAEALENRNVRYHLDDDSDIVSIDPDELPLPQIFGCGTDHQSEEAFDWSDWYGQWEPEPELETVF